MTAPLAPEAVEALRNFKVNGGHSLGHFATIDFIDQTIREVDGFLAAMLNSELEGSGITDEPLAACLEGVQNLLALLALSEQCRRASK